MSNVLIGIIGVILFIGLALAGALFLGPRFQESTNSSKASAAVQAVSQVARAAEMYQTSTGTQISNSTSAGMSTSALMTQGYLKSVPGNPTNNPSPGILHNESGAFASGETGDVVMMSLGIDGKAVCDAVIRQTGNGDSSTAQGIYINPSDGEVGCRKNSGPNTSIGMVANGYVVYARI